MVGTLLIGSMFAHAVELQHECIHGLAFRNKTLNRIVGTLLGLPMFVSFSHYRVQHLHHHRHIGRSSDLEFFPITQNINVKTLAISLTGAKRLKSAVENILASIGLPPSREKVLKPSAKREYALITAIFFICIAMSLVFGSLLAVKLWFLPLLLVAEPLHFLIELPEHLFCDKISTDIFKNSRTIRGSALSTWFTNGNNFHVEHHRKPQLAISQLAAEYYATPMSNYKFHEISYLGFYQKVLASLWRKNALEVIS
jgi:fatty acid desaturase